MVPKAVVYFVWQLGLSKDFDNVTAMCIKKFEIKPSFSLLILGKTENFQTGSTLSSSPEKSVATRRQTVFRRGSTRTKILSNRIVRILVGKSPGGPLLVPAQ